jgi:hypothetical protein
MPKTISFSVSELIAYSITTVNQVRVHSFQKGCETCAYNTSQSQLVNFRCIPSLTAGHLRENRASCANCIGGSLIRSPGIWDCLGKGYLCHWSAARGEGGTYGAWSRIINNMRHPFRVRYAQLTIYSLFSTLYQSIFLK